MMGLSSWHQCAANIIDLGQLPYLTAINRKSRLTTPFGHHNFVKDNVQYFLTNMGSDINVFIIEVQMRLT